MPIIFDNDYDVIFEKPIDKLSKNPLDFTNDGSISSFKVYNNDKVSTVVSGAQSSDRINVSDARSYQTGDVIEVRLPDKTLWDSGAITSIDLSSDELTVTNLNPFILPQGPCRVRLGSEIAMSEYGEALVGSNDYGFFGVMPWDHPGLEIGMEIEILMVFTGSPPSGLRVTRRLVDTVVDNLIDVG